MGEWDLGGGGSSGNASLTLVVPAPTGVPSVDTSNIQEAINELPAGGGIVQLQSGIYAVSSTLTMGNGSAAAVSTKSGIVLAGPGGAPHDVNLGYNQTDPVKLIWDAAFADVPMVSILGPVSGCGLRGIVLDTQENAGEGLRLTSAQMGRFADLSILNASSIGIREVTVNNFGGFICNTYRNTWDGITIYIPDLASTVYGWFLSSTPSAGDGAENTCYESIRHLNVISAKATNGETQIGVYHQYCDNIRIQDVVFDMGVPTSGTAYPLAYDWGYVSSCPADCIVDGVDFSGSATPAHGYNTGSQTGTPINRIYNISKVNGVASNPAITGVNWGYLVANP